MQESTTARARKLGALAYLLTWPTGLVVYVLADEDETFARWHAVQAIGLGVAFYLALVVVSVLAALLALASFGRPGIDSGLGFPPPLWVGLGGGPLGGLLPLALLAAIVALAVQAYNGERPRVPLLASIADDLA